MENNIHIYLGGSEEECYLGAGTIMDVKDTYMDVVLCVKDDHVVKLFNEKSGQEVKQP
jgi:hypothetical protein|tara:strand:- start:478 stop:651 length:174 start_codon:yes stop_codon:yes gene_type:complete